MQYSVKKIHMCNKKLNCGRENIKSTQNNNKKQIIKEEKNNDDINIPMAPYMHIITKYFLLLCKSLNNNLIFLYENLFFYKYCLPVYLFYEMYSISFFV